MNRFSRERLKFAAIPVLAAVLGYAIYDGLGSADSAHAPAAAQTPQPATPATAPPVPQQAAARRPVADNPAQSLSLAEIMRHDPFGLIPATVADAEVEPDAPAQPAPVPNLQVTAIAIDRDGQWTALVADRVLRVGDVAAAGYRVAAIDRTGVTLRAE